MINVMFCTKCGKQQRPGSKFCHNCGEAMPDRGENKRLDEVELNKGVAKNSEIKIQKTLEFYSVPPSKYILLSIATFGLYDIFWFARNFTEIQRQEKSKISPVARGLFAIFFYSELARKVLSSAKYNGYDKKYNPTTLAFLFFVTVLLSRAPEYFWFLGFLSILTILPTVKAIKFNNEKMGFPVRHEYSTGEIITLFLGFLVWCLVALGILSEISGQY